MDTVEQHGRGKYEELKKGQDEIGDDQHKGDDQLKGGESRGNPRENLE
jgi:hypothetical protein